MLVAAEVAGEHQTLAEKFNFESGSAQNVSRRAEGDEGLLGHLNAGCKLLFAELTDGLDCVFFVVERERRVVLREFFLSGVCGVFDLNACRVSQNHFGKTCRELGAEDLATETVFDEARQVAAVIEVCMAENHCIDLGRVDRQGLPVLKAQFFQSLEKTAIDHDLGVTAGQ